MNNNENISVIVKIKSYRKISSYYIKNHTFNPGYLVFLEITVFFCYDTILLDTILLEINVVSIFRSSFK